MTGDPFDYAKEAFAFIEKLDRLAAPESVIDAMEESFALFGFENFIMTGLPHPDQSIEPLVLLKKWPLEWFRIYTSRSYDRYDPVIRLCRQTVHPFEWAEASYDPDAEPRAAEIMGRASDFGMRQGYCLPIHGLNGYEACLSMSGRALDLTPQTKPAIHLMAIYAFERVRQILTVPQHVNPLTAREREVLYWAAEGKSASDTSIIMGVTERTVTAHIANVCLKLRAVNKTQAVARALQHRFIRI